MSPSAITAAGLEYSTAIGIGFSDLSKENCKDFCEYSLLDPGVRWETGLVHGVKQGQTNVAVDRSKFVSRRIGPPK